MPLVETHNYVRCSPEMGAASAAQGRVMLMEFADKTKRGLREYLGVTLASDREHLRPRLSAAAPDSVAVFEDEGAFVLGQSVLLAK
jgi:hypothetical protein